MSQGVLQRLGRNYNVQDSLVPLKLNTIFHHDLVAFSVFLEVGGIADLDLGVCVAIRDAGPQS